MYLYTGCEYVIRLSLLLTVGVNLFQMALSQRFKDAVSGSAVIVAALYMGTRYPLLDCERVDTKYEMSVRLTLREETGQCNPGIPAAPLRRNNYGRGHGRYKQPPDSVLPFIQGEERYF